MRKIIKYLLLGLLIINFLYLFSGIINFSVTSIDVYSILLLKARDFYFNCLLPLSNLNQFPYSHPQYPILIPLVATFIYKIIGEAREVLFLLIYPFIYLAILFLAYRLFRRLKINENMSLIFTYVYSMFGPLLAAGGRMHAGEADIFLVLIYWAIMHLILNYFKDGKRALGVMISILIAVASQIKLEGVIPVVILIFIPAKIRDKITWIALSVVPAIIWSAIIAKRGIKADFGFFLPNLAELFTRFGILLLLTMKEMSNYRNWYIFWPLFWVVIYLGAYAKKNLFQLFITKTLILMVVLFAVNYLINTQETANYVISSLDRVMLQLSPFVFTIFVMKFAELKILKSIEDMLNF